MTYLNKGQFYPITLKEVSSSEGIHHPISKVRVSGDSYNFLGDMVCAATLQRAWAKSHPVPLNAQFRLNPAGVGLALLLCHANSKGNSQSISWLIHLLVSLSAEQGCHWWWDRAVLTPGMRTFTFSLPEKLLAIIISNVAEEPQCVSLLETRIHFARGSMFFPELWKQSTANLSKASKPNLQWPFIL